MNVAMKAADMNFVTDKYYVEKYSSFNGDKYWAVDPTSKDLTLKNVNILHLKKHELFEEVVYLTALMLHKGVLAPNQVSDDIAKYFPLLKELAIEKHEDIFERSFFDNFPYYKTKASFWNITLYLKYCAKAATSTKGQTWLRDLYKSSNIVRIFFPNLFETNVRTFSTGLQKLKVVETDARSQFSQQNKLKNVEVYMECNPFVIFLDICKDLTPKREFCHDYEFLRDHNFTRVDTKHPESNDYLIENNNTPQGRKRAAPNAWGEVVSGVHLEPKAANRSRSYEATLEPVVNNKILRTKDAPPQQRELSASDEEEDESSSENNSTPQGRKRAARNAWGELLSSVHPEPIPTNESQTDKATDGPVNKRWAVVRTDIKKPKNPPPPQRRELRRASSFNQGRSSDVSHDSTSASYRGAS